MSSERPRIGVDATVFDAKPSGARRRFVELFRRLVEEAGGVDRLFYSGRRVTLERFAPFAAGRTRESPFSPGRPIRRTLLGTFWWASRAARDRLRLLHVHALPVPDVLARTRVVLTLHDLRSHALPHLHAAWRRRFVELAIAAARTRACAFVTPSEFTKQELVSRFRIGEERVHVVPNAPTDVEPSDAVLVRRRLLLPERFLLAVSHLEARKNLSILIEALASIPELPLLVVGAGRERRRLLAQAEALGVAARLRIAERLTDADVAALYASAAVFLFPSLHEGFGIPLLEAMAAGAPVVAANTSAIPEVAGDAAILLPPDDAGAWAEAVRSLLESDQRRQALAEAGRARAARFSWDQSASALARLERELLAG